eukprot:COSAG01_NODE_3133_length_6533_cov_117.587842_3_plen_245_part_00
MLLFHVVSFVHTLAHTAHLLSLLRLWVHLHAAGSQHRRHRPGVREEDPVPPQHVCTALEIEASPSHAPTPRRTERVLRVAGAGQELPVQLPLDGGGVGHPLAHEDVDRLEAALVPCRLLADAAAAAPQKHGAVPPALAQPPQVRYSWSCSFRSMAVASGIHMPTKTSIVWKPHWSYTPFLTRLCRRSTEPRGVSSSWIRTVLLRRVGLIRVASCVEDLSRSCGTLSQVFKIHRILQHIGYAPCM